MSTTDRLTWLMLIDDTLVRDEMVRPLYRAQALARSPRRSRAGAQAEATRTRVADVAVTTPSTASNPPVASRIAPSVIGASAIPAYPIPSIIAATPPTAPGVSAT